MIKKVISIGNRINNILGGKDEFDSKNKDSLVLLDQSTTTASSTLITKPDTQYVIISFDGSRSIPMWNETRQFAKDMASKELFGADQEFVWKHLESQFKVGMTRKNHSLKGWHIDHIKPMASFNLNDPEEQKKCCHYSNLQPLWWWENLEKSDKIVA